jgi:hypothetical protein
MKQWLARLGWMALGVVATSFALGWTVRHQREWEFTTEVALNGIQAFIHIPTNGAGYEMSPAAIFRANAMRVLSPFAFVPPTQRAYHHEIIVIDGRGVRKMVFQGLGGPFQVTSEGPVVRVGDQLCRWNGGALVTLTPEEGDAVQRDYTGPVRPPWGKHAVVFWSPAKVVPFTIDGAHYQLEAHRGGDVKTLTLVDRRGGRQVIWTLDEAFRSTSAEDFRRRFGW